MFSPPPTHPPTHPVSCIQLHHPPDLACLRVVVEGEGGRPVVEGALDLDRLAAVKVRL